MTEETETSGPLPVTDRQLRVVYVAGIALNAIALVVAARSGELLGALTRLERKPIPFRGGSGREAWRHNPPPDTPAVIPTLRFFGRPPDDSPTANFPPLNASFFFQLL
jgi:hypothetical protein